MSQRSILSASVQASFPDNTSGFITPAGLRNEQGLFVSYSVLNEQTASIIAQAVATASVGGGNVTTSSFNAYTASTNTFTSSIQTQVNTLQSATSSYVNNTQTSSFVNNSQTSSMLAPYVQNSQTSSFATTGSNSFSGSNTFSGSVFIQTASISVLYADKIVSSSTIFSSGSNTLGDASDDTQTLWGTIDIKTGPLKVSGSTDISGSLLINGSSPILSNQTGSFATTGANVFTGSQTLSSSTTPASLLLNVSGALPSFVTESRSTTTGFGNIIFNGRTGATLSGSVVVSGSGNIVYYSGISTTANGGFIGINNLGVVPTYSGSVPNYNFNVAPSTFIVSASTPITIASNWIAGASPTYITNTTATSSFSFNVVNGASIRISASLSGSSTGTSVGVNNNNLGGASHLIQFEGSSSVARNFSQNTILGNSNTASLTSVSGASITTGSLLNTAILGSNLVVSGTMSNASLSASVFVGQYNETGSLADPTRIKFAVGAGTSNTARKTSFYVSGSGDVIIRPGGDQYGINIFQRSKAVINDGLVGGYTSSLTAATTATAIGCVNAQINGAADAAIALSAIDTTITGGTSQTAVGTNNVTMVTTTPKRLNTMLGVFTATISGSDVCSMIASNDSFIANSLNSVILGGVNVRLNNTTGSVALDRDAAYTGSANYTLFTQNINTSGSVTVNGNKQYNVGAFSSTASQSGSANVSQSVTYDTTDISSGVSIVSGSQITIANAGTYNIQFSAQIDRISGSGTDEVYFWLKKNGSNVANSAGVETVSGGAAAAKTIVAWNFVTDAAANDYFELAWQTTDTNIHLTAATASGNIPAIPSIIVTVTQVR
jgi:hypothetical protein